MWQMPASAALHSTSAHAVPHIQGVAGPSESPAAMLVWFAAGTLLALALLAGPGVARRFAASHGRGIELIWWERYHGGVLCDVRVGSACPGMRLNEWRVVHAAGETRAVASSHDQLPSVVRLTAPLPPEATPLAVTFDSGKQTYTAPFAQQPGGR